MTNIFKAALIAFFCTGSLAFAEDGAEPSELPSKKITVEHRTHPFLFGGRGVYERARRRAEKYDWAKKAAHAVVKAADGVLADPPTVPDKGGQWSHHYVCKECSHKLEHRDGKHICKNQKCAKTYSGWPYDDVILTRRHNDLLGKDLPNLGVAYQLTGDEKYAAEGRRILLDYAAKYAGYEVHNRLGKANGKGARIFSQTLDDAVAMVRAAWAYDMLYPAGCFSKEDKNRIEENFLRPSAATILRNPAGRSNWQTWHNGAVAAIGFCLQDQKLVDTALYKPKNGVMYQLKHSILPDGFWYEGTMAYHSYALTPLEATARACKYAGLDLFKDKRLMSMYLAPMEYAAPNGLIPAISDSNVFSLKQKGPMYAVAYAMTGDPRLLALAQIKPSRDMLLWGPDELPDSQEISLGSRVFKGLGVAILRRGEGRNANYVHLDYNTLDRGHGHPDKLAVVFSSLGKRMAIDASRLPYAAPLHSSWYRQTVAHNTVVVDMKSSNSRASGKLICFKENDGCVIASAATEDAYKGVNMKRTVLLTDDYMVDVFQVTSNEEHTYDWVWHNLGECRPGPKSCPAAPPIGKGHGYQHIRDVRQAATAETWHVDFLQEDANVRVTMLGAPETTICFGRSPVNNPPEYAPVVLARRKAKTTTFVCVVEPYKQAPKVTGVNLTVEDTGLRVTVARGNSTTQHLVGLPERTSDSEGR